MHFCACIFVHSCSYVWMYVCVSKCAQRGHNIATYMGGTSWLLLGYWRCRQGGAATTKMWPSARSSLELLWLPERITTVGAEAKKCHSLSNSEFWRFLTVSVLDYSFRPDMGGQKWQQWLHSDTVSVWNTANTVDDFRFWNGSKTQQIVRRGFPLSRGGDRHVQSHPWGEHCVEWCMEGLTWL